MGRAPDLRSSENFGKSPMLVVTARHVRTGVTCELTQLVELLASGPPSSEPYISCFAERGAKGSSGLSWAGRILEITEGREFILQVGEELVTSRKIDGRHTPDPSAHTPSC